MIKPTIPIWDSGPHTYRAFEAPIPKESNTDYVEAVDLKINKTWISTEPVLISKFQGRMNLPPNNSISLTGAG